MPRSKRTPGAAAPAAPVLPAEIVMRRTADLIPYARNSRTHDDRQVAQIAASIKEFGFTSPVLIDGDDGIIAGHGRVLAAQALDLAEVPCIPLGHLTPAQRRAYIIADNKLAENAGWNTDILRDELAHLEGSGFNLAVIGFEPAELKMLMGAGELLDPTDGRAERGTELPRLWIGEKAVLITSGESDMLDAEFERWLDTHDDAAGFAAHYGLFDVVVCDSVVNSVDSAQAEADVMTCLSALCRPGGRVYFSGRARDRVDRALRGSMQADQRRMIEFLDEDGFTAIYREGNWFYQKYHDEPQARALATKYIGAPREYDATSNSWRVYASRDIEIDPDAVRAAITREFDLMWPGGRSVGRADRMLAAWDRARNMPSRTASSGTS